MPDSGLDRLTRMAMDPEVTGDMLALGVPLTAATDGDLDPDPLNLNTVNRMAFPDSPTFRDQRNTRAAQVIHGDRRRYVPPEPNRRCDAPMVRRTGLCGKSATMMALVTADWSTGEQQHVEACTRHSGWWERIVQQYRDSRPQVGTVPDPPANTGGVLRRHLPEIDWVELWQTLAPMWVEPREPSGNTTPGEPVEAGLRLVSSNNDPAPRHGGVPPLLAVSSGTNKEGQ